MKWENFAEVPELIRKYGMKSAYLRIYYHFIYHYIRKLNPLWKLYYNRKNERGSEIMYEDWDFLILLDALRFDVFRDFHKLEGRLESIISLGAGSWEFMCENFEGQQFHDTIYVTANAYAERLEDGIFYKQISVVDQWDEDIGTVHPSSVIEIAKELAGKHPNKRLIIHMMQPHDPHLGELRNKIGKVMSEKNNDNKIMFKACKMQIITRQELIHSYIQNFLFVQDYLDSLIESLDGKIVISADHGENLGERKFGVRVWEHSIHTRECRKVPWFVIEANSRKKIVEERPETSIRLDETIVNQRLAELGYL
jgi:hypothetical protein